MSIIKTGAKIMNGINFRGLPLKERFDLQYTPEPNSGCWLWVGQINTRGYGTLSKDGRRTLAHRVSYELHKGPITDGLLVCHKCDIPLCVNPYHLFLGTYSDNMYDSASKGRHCYQNYKNTEKRKSTRLSMALAEDIRKQYASGVRITDIAKSLKVGWTTIHSVVTDRAWVKR